MCEQLTSYESAFESFGVTQSDLIGFTVTESDGGYTLKIDVPQCADEVLISYNGVVLGALTVTDGTATYVPEDFQLTSGTDVLTATILTNGHTGETGYLLIP